MSWPSVIYSIFFMVCVHLQIHSSFKKKSTEPLLLSPGSPLLPSDLVSEIIYPYAPTLWNYLPEELSSASLCHLSRWLLIPILCNRCLPQLVLFGPVYLSLLFLSHFSVCSPLFYFILFGVFGHPFNLLFINIGLCLASCKCYKYIISYTKPVYFEFKNKIK